jgi:hypothetical protein
LTIGGLAEGIDFDLRGIDGNEHRVQTLDLLGSLEGCRRNERRRGGGRIKMMIKRDDDWNLGNVFSRPQKKREPTIGARTPLKPRLPAILSACSSVTPLLMSILS